MADVYFAHVKGMTLRTNLRRVLEQRKPVGVSQLQNADEAQLSESRQQGAAVSLMA